MERRVEYHRVGDVVPAPNNPKGHALKELGGSINEFGFVEPILRDDRTGRLIAGHGRIEALTAKRNAGEEPPDGIRLDHDGEWLLPVVVGWASHSDAQAAAYLAIANHHPTLGGWDGPGLAELLDGLDDHLRDLVAFDLKDLEKLLDDGTEDLPDPGDAPTDDLDERVWGVAVTCDDERQQAELLERLTVEGYHVRALM